jgi:hypothetical protein
LRWGALCWGQKAAQLADGWNVPLEAIAHLPSQLWSQRRALCASGIPEDGARPEALVNSLTLREAQILLNEWLKHMKRIVER